MAAKISAKVDESVDILSVIIDIYLIIVIANILVFSIIKIK
jgi:hypothetical protein